jgi:hypothetical protein
MNIGNVKILLIVLVVISVNAAGICYMMSNGPEAASAPAVVHTPQASTTRPVQKPPKWEPEEACPPVEEAPSEEVPPPVVVKPVEAVAPLRQEDPPEPEGEYDPLLGERFDEAQVTAAAESRLIAGGLTPEEEEKNREVAKIDAQVKKIENQLNRKLNTVASRMKLDDRTRADLIDISKEGLDRIAEIRKQFAGTEMTESDRAYMHEQIRAENINTTRNIATLLGEDAFKEYRKETRYYDNPNARVLDEIGDLKKQNQQLQKKVDQQSRKSGGQSNPSGAPRNQPGRRR